MHIERLVCGEWRTVRIENVLHVLQIKKNLLSVGVCTRKGFKLEFEDKVVRLYAGNELFGSGIL